MLETIDSTRANAYSLHRVVVLSRWFSKGIQQLILKGRFNYVLGTLKRIHLLSQNTISYSYIQRENTRL